MILACNLQLLKINHSNKEFLCMLLWEEKPMHANWFSQSQRETINSVAHERDCSTIGEKCAFLAWSQAGCVGDLRNFWAEQLTATHICTNSGLSNLVGEICANPSGRIGRQDCIILETSRLPERIAQFLEGRLFSFQKFAIFKGTLLNLQLDQVQANNL